jgi:hypothetical protein
MMCMRAKCKNWGDWETKGMSPRGFTSCHTPLRNGSFIRRREMVVLAHVPSVPSAWTSSMMVKWSLHCRVMRTMFSTRSASISGSIPEPHAQSAELPLTANYSLCRNISNQGTVSKRAQNFWDKRLSHTWKVFSAFCIHSSIV